MNTPCVVFKYSGRFAHFLKAEANASAPTYPVPPRTVMLGVIGAILGLEKDAPQVELKYAQIAIRGKAEYTHWHTTNFRKELPSQLPYTIKKNNKGNSSEPKITQIAQEWLFKARYTIWVHLPDHYHREFEKRVRQRQWYYSPSMGLTEMAANIEWVDCGSAVSLANGEYNIHSIVRHSQGQLNMAKSCDHKLVIKSMKLPRDLSPQREFTHEGYFIEAEAKPLPVITEHAWQVGEDIIMWS